MAVKPIAGTARMVPATRPLIRSCPTSPSTGSERGDDLELALLGLLEADLAVENVAGLGEVTRAARALVVDRLALGEQLEPLDRVVDLHARPLRDPAQMVPHRGAGGLPAGVADGEAHEARVIVALAGVGIEVVAAESLGEAPVAGGLERGGGLGSVDAVGDLGGQRGQELGVGRVAEGDAAPGVARLVQLLGQHRYVDRK